MLKPQAASGQNRNETKGKGRRCVLTILSAKVAEVKAEAARAQYNMGIAKSNIDKVGDVSTSQCNRTTQNDCRTELYDYFWIIFVDFSSVITGQNRFWI